MQKEVVNWILTIEENKSKKTDKLYVLFLHYPEESIMKKQKINMWYYDNSSGYFQFVNNHDYTFFAHINNKHIELTLNELERIFSIKHARKLVKPAQIRVARSKPAESMEIE